MLSFQSRRTGADGPKASVVPWGTKPGLQFTAGCVHWKYCPRCIVKIHLKPEDVLIFIFVKKKS